VARIDEHEIYEFLGQRGGSALKRAFAEPLVTIQSLGEEV